MQYFEAVILNLDYNTSEEDIYNIFQECGKILNIKLIRRKCFVKFAQPEGLTTALEMNGKTIKFDKQKWGRKIKSKMKKEDTITCLKIK